jgi:hypothetical protein
MKWYLELTVVCACVLIIPVAASHRLCLLASFLTGLQVEAYLEKALDSASLWKHAGERQIDTTCMWEGNTYSLPTVLYRA